MATHALGADSALANPLLSMLSPGCTPVKPLLRLLSRFDRNKVEAFAEISIAMLDLIDGDADAEDDDPDFALDEGEPNFTAVRDEGAGCPISDPDHEHDGREHEDGY